jgi:alpha-galactosidase
VVGGPRHEQALADPDAEGVEHGLDLLEARVRIPSRLEGANLLLGQPEPDPRVGQTGRESPREFRFHIAVQGVLGIGGNILRWTAEERARARELVDQYKRLRPIVQLGTQYWLLPPAPLSPCAVQYVSDDRDETVVLLYQIHGLVGQGPRRARLRGLDPARRYRRASDGAESTGAALMAAGRPIAFAEPPAPPHVRDWGSRVELWQAVDE